jgi:hypothetical protein
LLSSYMASLVLFYRSNMIFTILRMLLDLVCVCPQTCMQIIHDSGNNTWPNLDGHQNLAQALVQTATDGSHTSQWLKSSIFLA